jgi:3-hydroxyisobutyrate dehydrogenase
MRVVFIGLGKMGAPMARHLHAGGHDVVGVEPAAARRAQLAGSAFPMVETVAEAATDGLPLAIVSSLPDDDALRAAGAALAPLASPGAVFIDTSTVSLSASADTAAACAALKLAYLRAPVSGNATMAEAARLTVMASGDEPAYRRCEALFACWGPTRFYLGAGDEARVAKLAVNLLVAGSHALLAEALVLGQRGGVARDALWQVIEGSAVASPLLHAKAPALRAGDYSPTFTVAQMCKDVGLMTDTARQFGLSLPHTMLVADALRDAAADGASKRDYAWLIHLAERAAGLQPTSPNLE